MRSMDIQELKDQASRIVNAGEPILIQRDRRPVRLYVPLKQAGTLEQAGTGDKAHASQLVSTIQRLMEEMAAQNGLTADELADEIERLAAEDRQAL